MRKLSAAPAYSRYAQAAPDRFGYSGRPDRYEHPARYDRYAQPGRIARPERTGRPGRSAAPDISVVPGRGSQTHEQPLSPALVFLAKTAAVVLVFLALLGCARIALSTATVTTAIETRELTSQIDVARSEGNALEVAQSSLSNPTRIKDAATLLGMSAPAYVANIDLSGDVVVVDAAGKLSLSGSAAVLTQG